MSSSGASASLQSCLPAQGFFTALKLIGAIYFVRIGFHTFR